MAGKVLPGFRPAGDTNASGSPERQFAVTEPGTSIGIGVDPYDSAARGSVYVRDAVAENLTDLAGVVEEGKEPVREEPGPVDVERGAGPGHGPDRPDGPFWEDELSRQGGDFQKAYTLHMTNLSRRFKSDLMLRIERETELLSDQSAEAVRIEAERKNTIDYAMAAYGDGANLKGITERAAVAQQVNAKEMTGPGAGLSFRINQKLSGGKDSLVMLPNGRQVEMDAGVAAVLGSPAEAKGDVMAGLFTEYVRDKDPGFMQAMSQAGGTGTLANSCAIQFNERETAEIGKMWSRVVDAQSEVAGFEAKPTDRLSPKEYEELGLDRTDARARRLAAYGDPSASLGIVYSHEFEYNGRPLPTPRIIGYGGGQREMDGPGR